jgi:glycerophosphoryl diester phosphodiesterase
MAGLLIDGVSGPVALERFEESGADFLAPDYRLLDDPTIARANQSRIRLLPWTVNDSRVIERLLRQSSVFGIITDETADGVRLRNTAQPRM